MDEEALNFTVFVIINLIIYIVIPLVIAYRKGYLQKWIQKLCKKNDISLTTPTNDASLLEDIEWTLEDERPFTDDEKNSITSLEVVSAMDGSLSVKCSIKEGGQTFIRLAEGLVLPVGTYLDKDKVILREWKKENIVSSMTFISLPSSKTSPTTNHYGSKF